VDALIEIVLGTFGEIKMMNENIKKASDTPGYSLALFAESLYLLNLLVIPGIAFLILVWFFFKYENDAPPLAGCHLRQTFSASIWAGLLLMLVPWVIFAITGYDAPYTWVFVISYFIVCHSILIFLGIFGLMKAMAGEIFHYPIIGPST